jgi:hypothetical protein
MRVNPRSISRLAPVLAALAIVACTGRSGTPVPARDQLAPITQQLKDRVRANQATLEQDGFAKVRPAIDRTLADIEREYGARSVEVPQSLTQTGAMILEAGEATDAEPYMRRAMEASIGIYGAEHRETAFAVGDYGLTLVSANPDKFVPAATPFLERALAIRRNLLGVDAPETAGSERSLALQLFAQCRSKPGCGPADPLLERALAIARHAHEVLRIADLNKPNSEVFELHQLVNDLRRARNEAPVDEPQNPGDAVVNPHAPDGDATRCGRSRRDAISADLSWVRTGTPLYRLTRSRGVAVGGFDGRPWKKIATGKLVFSDQEVTISASRRWLAFSSNATGSQDLDSEMWLFDTKNESARRIATLPRLEWLPPSFSPDGNTLAYLLYYDERWKRADPKGLYLIDTRSGTSTFAGLPADSVVGTQLATGGIDWSADGTALLLYLVGHPDGKFTREFYRFDLRPRKFRKIDDVFREDFRHGEEYVDRGRAVSTYQTTVPSTRAWYGELRSPAGAWRARIDDAHRLLISNAAGAQTLVAVGGYDECEGVTIGITGWIDDRYLVYRSESRQIIYDRGTKRRALLLGEADAGDSYTW